MRTFEINLRVQADEMATAELVRDRLAQDVEADEDLVLIAASCAGAMPLWVVHGVDTDRRKRAPEAFSETVEAEDAAAAETAVATPSKIVSLVQPADAVAAAAAAEEPSDVG